MQLKCESQTFGVHTDLYKVPDAIPPIHAESYHVGKDKVPAEHDDKFWSIFSDNLAERKHVARYWLINTVATAVPLSAYPSPLVITTKYWEFRCSEEGLCRPSTTPVGVGLNAKCSSSLVLMKTFQY